MAKIGFIPDDRLPHDRKIAFARNVAILKSKLNMEMIPVSLGEKEVNELIENEKFTLILMPWYKYLAWKKPKIKVAGYFADSVLPFEFAKLPNFSRLVLIDFFRFDREEVENIVLSLAANSTHKTKTVYQADWYENDRAATRCIDAAMNLPLFKQPPWNKHAGSIRIYLTAIWMLCYEVRFPKASKTPVAELSIFESGKTLGISLSFESTDLPPKTMMEELWPTDSGSKNKTIRELVRHADFIRVLYYAEARRVEVCAFFTESAPASEYPGEVRGFWIEPILKIA